MFDARISAAIAVVILGALASGCAAGGLTGPADNEAATTNLRLSAAQPQQSNEQTGTGARKPGFTVTPSSKYAIAY